jgi:hypothetical protein
MHKGEIIMQRSLDKKQGTTTLFAPPHFALGLKIVLITLMAVLFFVACPTETTTTTIVEEVDNDPDPSVLKYWLVHEYYLDTQRLTKMIIDAGPGKTFKDSEIAKDTFKVHFESTHWHGGELHYAGEAGVGYGYRIIDDAYVTGGSLQSLVNDMAANRTDFFYGQSKLSKADQGRYLVLEFYSERERKEAGFVYDPVGHADDPTAGVLVRYIRAQRTPGAESGWNNHSEFVQHKHTYEVAVIKPFNRSGSGT